MKTNVAKWMVGLVLVVGVGCGADRVQTGADGEGEVGPTPQTVLPQMPGGDGEQLFDLGDAPDGADRVRPLEQQVVQNPSPLRAHLRLRGENPGLVTWFGLEVAQVQVSWQGQPLQQTVAGESGLDLGWTDHAWLLGAFDLPDEATSVEVLVRFATPASLETASGTAWVDANIAPLTFTAERAQLAQRGHAVLHLDIVDSLYPVDGGYLLLPQVTVRY
jgi:hypothetical protein